MSEPILHIDTSDIREGKLEELKTAMNELVEFVEERAPVDRLQRVPQRGR
jgi:hypothetical protein